MNEEIKETEAANVPSKEEIIDAIKSAFKDNKDSLKYVDSILNNVIELKKLNNKNTGSSSAIMWIMYLLFLFGIQFNDKPLCDIEHLEDKENEQSIKDGESDSVEESTQCS